MDETKAAPCYVCPMHSRVRQAKPGKCPACGMDLVPEGASFALVRHMFGSPMHIAVMAVLMVVIMAAAMMAMR